MPFVSIVGLPNVGKSTLFNRLIGRRKAIVHKTPGVTRDRNVAEAEWRGLRFYLVDTGGMMAPDARELDREVERQVRTAIRDSDLILFLVDGRSGVSPVEGEIARLLRREGCRLLLVANKVERTVDYSAFHAYSALGLGEPFPVSAMRGFHCGDLLDRIVEMVPVSTGPEPGGEGAIRAAVVGRPNAGKSSLINRILGEERLVVHAEAGTTRDSIDTFIDYGDRRIVLVDTAGLRRKSRIEEDIEYYANVRVIRSIERADVVVVLVDGTEGIVRQDLNILSLVERRGRGMVLAFSKWDLVGGDRRAYGDAVREEISFLEHLPMVFTSAVTGKGLDGLLDTVLRVGDSWRQRVPTPRLNRLLEEAVARRPPPAFGTKTVNLLYISQTGTAPPEFAIVSNAPRGIKEGYRRYLVNFLRERLDLEGVPLRIRFRERRRGSRVRE
jgi:GTP-binding protein